MALRARIHRSQLELNYSFGSSIQFKVAETRDELFQAFRLLHDTYVKTGLMEPDPSKLRITPFNALPGTTTLVAKDGEQVIATVSIIRDGEFGLPCEKIFDLSGLRKRKLRIAEVSALAVSKNYRASFGDSKKRIFVALTKFLFNYSYSYFGIEAFVIAIHPRALSFYQDILFFKKLPKTDVRAYSYVNNAPAVGASLIFSECEEETSLCYGRKPEAKNLYHYFYKASLSEFVFPKREYLTITNPVMTPELLDLFFNKLTQVFSKLSDRERVLLYNLYPNEAYRRVLPPLPARVRTIGRLTRRKNRRFQVKLRAVLTGTRLLRPVQTMLVDFSRSGVLLDSRALLKSDRVYSLQVMTKPNEVIQIRVTLVRQQRNGRYACEIVGDSSKQFETFVGHLENLGPTPRIQRKSQ